MEIARNTMHKDAVEGDHDLTVPMTADIVAQSEAWNEVADISTLIDRAVEVVATSPRVAGTGHVSPPMQGVTIVLSDDAEMRQLNKSFRNIDKPTNVLSFPSVESPIYPIDGEVGHLGDIVLSFETIKREAQTQGRSLNDHISHLVIHGLLHLSGYDHDSDTAADEMEQLETHLLAMLNIIDPYSNATTCDDD